MLLLASTLSANEWHHIDTNKISKKKCYRSRNQGYSVCRYRFNFIRLTDLCTFSESRQENSIKINCEIFTNFEKRYYQILDEKQWKD